MGVTTAVRRAFEIGMYQHEGEIVPFAEWLETQPRIHHVVEIGCLHGGTSYLWSRLSTGKVVSVDLPGGRFGGADHGYDLSAVEDRNLRLMQRIPRFTPVVGSSHEDSTLRQVAWALRGRLADLLFIDGDHTYGGVKSDWEMYSPLVTKGGVVAFHDINDTQFHHDVGCEVDKLWKELEGEKYEFTIHREWGGIGAMVLR